MAWPRWRYVKRSGGTAITPACRSASAVRSRARLAVSARIAKSVSRLNSAAPYNTHACPPMSRARTRCTRIEERTLRIGFGIKRSSERQIGLPQLLALEPTLRWREPIPLDPFVFDELLRPNHTDPMLQYSGPAWPITIPAWDSNSLASNRFPGPSEHRPHPRPRRGTRRPRTRYGIRRGRGSVAAHRVWRDSAGRGPSQRAADCGRARSGARAGHHPQGFEVITNWEKVAAQSGAK